MLEVWFKDDVAQGIAAVAIAMLSASVAGTANVEYCRGVVDTSRAHALLYGIPWAEMKRDLKQLLLDAERNDLLEVVYPSLE